MVAEDAILLVDADPADVEFTLLAFGENELGDCVRVAHGVGEALNLLYGEDGCHPALILLDLRLPDDGAVAVLRRIKGDWRTSTIPVVVLTSNAGADVLEAVGLGAAGTLAKPVDFEDFLDAVSAFSLYWRSRRAQRERAGSA
jgi:CheY-like chemotaxis protein